MICSFCKEEKRVGIEFLNNTICSSCLEKLTKLKVEDEEYNYYIEVIKNIIKKCQFS